MAIDRVLRHCDESFKSVSLMGNSIECYRIICDLW